MEIFLKGALAVFLSTISFFASRLGIEKRLLITISTLNIIIVLLIFHLTGGVDLFSLVVITTMLLFYGYIFWRVIASPFEKFKKIVSGIASVPQSEILKEIAKSQPEIIDKDPDLKKVFTIMRDLASFLKTEKEKVESIKKMLIDFTDFIRYLTAESDKFKVISEVRNFICYVIPNARVYSIIPKSSADEEIAEGKSFTIDGREYFVIGGDISAVYLRNIVVQGKFEDNVLGYVSYPLVFDSTRTAYLVIEGDNIQPEYKLLSYLVSKFMEAVLSRIDREQEIQVAAVTDPLTSTYNRRYFIERLHQAFSKYRRLGETYAIVIFDIDKFKKINDMYGHFVGDEILKALGYLIKEWVRKYDIAARFGGDEFVLLLDNIKKDDAINVAKRIANKFEQFSPVKDIVGGKVSVSWGLASVDEASDSFEDVVKLADKRLLKAKEMGGGRGVWE